MGLSKLAAKCRDCPYVGICQDKEMEAVGFLPIPVTELNSPDVDINVGVDLSAEFQVIFPEPGAEVLARIAEQFAASGYGTLIGTV